MAGDEPQEVLFEFVRIGTYVKATAIDPVTNEEASIVGPHSVGQAALRDAALRKLRYVLRKKREQGKL